MSVLLLRADPGDRIAPVGEARVGQCTGLKNIGRARRQAANGNGRFRFPDRMNRPRSICSSRARGSPPDLIAVRVRNGRNRHD